MKKIYLFVILLSIIFIPALSHAQGLVTCNGPDCTLQKLFDEIAKIYNFIVKDIATPLAVLGILTGAIIMMVSAGNSALFSKGRHILFITVIGLALVYCSWLIVNFVLLTLTGKGL